MRTLLSVADNLLHSVKIERTGRIVRLRTSATADVAALVNDVVLPAQAAASSAARRKRAFSHLRRLALAMHNYASLHDHLPPAVVIGPDGKTQHSWRVELLPFLGQKSLYEQYKMDEPWDSPANRMVLESRPDVFGYPESGADPMHTAYFVVVGQTTLFPFGGKGTRFADVRDGTVNTIMLVEARRSVPWTKPDDIPFDPAAPPPTFGGFQPESAGFNACFADGSVRFLKNSVNPDMLKALLTSDGGEVITLP